jgi:hypothetical protein
VEFGLCDKEDGTPAYTTLVADPAWVATVRNPHGKEVTFTAIDHCIEIPEIHRRCDCMLTTDDTLFLVELKSERAHWITGAVEQLESTMDLLRENEDLSPYRFKKGFACNRRHRHFQQVDHERNLRCFRDHGFRLDINATITV